MTMMPYITSQFQRRDVADRPRVIPQGAKNFALLGQYVEIPEDVVFTVEYSVRAAMHGVYGLLGLKRKIPAIYHGIAGAGLVDALFMVGLAAIGALLILGIGMRFACGAGALMVVLMWSAALPPENNLFLDDHIIYALTLVLLLLAGAGSMLGLGKGWNRLGIVQRHGFLQ